MTDLHPILQIALNRVIRARRALHAWRGFTWGWLAALVAALLVVWASRSGGAFASIPYFRWIFLLLFIAGSVVWWRRAGRRPDEAVQIVREIEERDPKLRALLLTSIEQRPSETDGSWGYLQERLFSEAAAAFRTRPWDQPFIERAFLSKASSLFWLACLMPVLWFLPNHGPAKARALAVAKNTIEVTPGDAEVEKGQSVAVLVRFPGAIPARARLVWTGADGLEKTLELARNLSDPVFGGTLPSLTRDAVYRVEYGSSKTRNYRLTVFEQPKLERADATLAHPAYTGLGERKMEDTKRVAAVEGTRMRLDLKLNKIIRSARLVATQRAPVELSISTTNAAALLPEYVFQTNALYGLELVDESNRTNLLPALFHFETISNRPPELKLIAPRGDSKVSPLQEIEFLAEVKDDFGVLAAGLNYTIPGKSTNDLTLLDARASTNADWAARGLTGKQSLHHLLALEREQLSPGALIAWHVWAEDTGPDGKPRRVTSDLYFSEVRPFLQVFRQGDLDQQENPGGNQGGQGGQAVRLAELQKQILNATWKLQSQTRGGRLPKNYEKDVGVVEESQRKALEQLSSMGEGDGGGGGGRSEAARKTAKESMEQAVEALQKSAQSPGSLAVAIQAEQAAYQALLRLAPREFEVTQSRQRNEGGGGGGERQDGGELDQLDLKSADQRYETQRQASERQAAGRNEDQQILNRLKELAQRQQDLNERINELASERNRARTEEEREEMDRRLKRLREEERQMLEDVDDLAQRLERRPPGEESADLRQQAREARDQVRQAADALDSRDVNDALAAGNRAARQFQEMREEARKTASNQLDEQVRQLRQDTRELAQKEVEINQRLRSAGENRPRSLGAPSEREELARAMNEQAERMNRVWNDASRINESAEASEPAFSRQLYDALRQAAQQNARSFPETRDQLMREGALTRDGYDLLEEARQQNRKPIEVAQQMLRGGSLRETAALEQRILTNIMTLQRGVDSAASRLLGDDTEALRRARRELDALTESLAKEADALAGESTNRLAAAGGVSTNAASTNLAGGAGRGGTNAPTRGPRQLASQSNRGEGEQNAAQPGSNAGGDSPAPSAENPSGSDSNRPQTSSDSPGSAQGQGQGQGERGQGEGRSQAQAQAQSQAQAGEGRGPNPGQGGRRGLANRSGTPGSPAQRGGANDGGRRAGGGGGGVWDGRFGGAEEGPVLGEQYAEWSDRLRDVEDAVELPGLRERISGVRERAREMRIDSRRHSRPPQADLFRNELLTPLIEVRSRIMEELARRESKDALVPLDRDPVPARYSELVRRYYERLGQGQ